MIYIFDDISNYTDEIYLNHLSIIPEWRKKKALSYKVITDRKLSVISFVLLIYALKKEYGIDTVNKFNYNDYGKPFIEDAPINFSISHCKNAVVCAISKNSIGVDVEDYKEYNYNIAKRVCSNEELLELEKADNPNELFCRYWTIKEAISKFEGLGLSIGFSDIDKGEYTVLSFDEELYCLSICYGKKNVIEGSAKINNITIEELLFY